MLNVGMTELLVFGVIALLVLGPEKLPEPHVLPENGTGTSNA